MSVTYDVAELRRATALASSFLDNEQPILKHFLLKGNQLRASDGTTGCAVRLSSTIETPVLVPGKVLTRLLGTVSAETIDVIVTSSRVSFSGEGLHANFAAGDANYFPIIELPKKAEWQRVDEDFWHGVQEVEWAAGKDDTKSAYRSILADPHGFASCDSHRVTFCSAKVGKERATTIPAYLLSRFSAHRAEAIGMARIGGVIYFRLKDAIVYSPLLNTPFPPYMEARENAENAEGAKPVKMDSAIMRAALFRLTLFVDKEAPRVDVQLKPGKMDMRVRAMHELVESVPVEYRGPEVSFGVRLDFFRAAVERFDAFRVVQASDVPLLFTNGNGGWHVLQRYYD